MGCGAALRHDDRLCFAPCMICEIDDEQTIENAWAMNPRRKRVKLECGIDTLEDWLHPYLIAAAANTTTKLAYRKRTNTMSASCCSC